MIDPEATDALRRQPLDGDDNPPVLTSYQTRKCATIIDAYLHGHDGWRDHAHTIVAFLHAAATEGATGSKTVMSRPTSELWPLIDTLPWPPSGAPKPQHDT